MFHQVAKKYFQSMLNSSQSMTPTESASATAHRKSAIPKLNFTSSSNEKIEDKDNDEMFLSQVEHSASSRYGQESKQSARPSNSRGATWSFVPVV